MLDFTTAPSAELQATYRIIAREVGDDRFFTTKELALLPRILAPMEQVLSFTSGYMDSNTWLLTLTNQRILFLDKGLIFGHRQLSVELGNITAIDGQTGLFFGTIRIANASGWNEVRNVWKKTVVPFVNKTREALAARAEGRIISSPTSRGDDFNLTNPSASVGEREIAQRRLDFLREQGVLTNAQYLLASRDVGTQR